MVHCLALLPISRVTGRSSRELRRTGRCFVGGVKPPSARLRHSRTLAGVATQATRPLLRPIQSHCLLQRRSPLTILVVEPATGVPGAIIAAGDIPKTRSVRTRLARSWCACYRFRECRQRGALERASARTPPRNSRDGHTDHVIPVGLRGRFRAYENAGVSGFGRTTPYRMPVRLGQLTKSAFEQRVQSVHQQRLYTNSGSSGWERQRGAQLADSGEPLGTARSARPDVGVLGDGP